MGRRTVAFKNGGAGPGGKNREAVNRRRNRWLDLRTIFMTGRVQITAMQHETSPAPQLAHVVQRSCACGGPAGLTDSCETCNAKDLAGAPVQAKLVVGPVNDP